MHSTLRTIAGTAATYTRATDSLSCTLTVVPARPVEFDDLQQSVSIVGQRQDFLIQADHIVLDGDVVTPKRGDTITATIAGRVQKFRLISPAFRPSDNDQNILRVFTEAIQ